MRSEHRFPLVLDILLLVLLLAAGMWFYWRIDDVLQYRWQWERIGSFLLYRGPDGQWAAGPLLRGLVNTVRLSLWSMLFALCCGTVFGLLRTRSRLLARLLSGTYVGIVRNIPPLVLVFIFYFFVSSQMLPLLGLEDAMRGLSP